MKTGSGSQLTAALIASLIGGSAAQSCFETNALDAAQGAGQCETYITGGVLTCAAELAPGGAYEGYCNADCGFDFIEYPTLFGLDLATSTAWMSMAPMAPFIDAIGAVTGQSGLTATAAAGLLVPGLCNALIAADPTICESTLNAGAPGNFLDDIFGLPNAYCAYSCDCQCGTYSSACPVPPPPPPLWGECRTYDFYDAMTDTAGNVQAGHCANFIHQGIMSCSTAPEHQASSAAPGGAYAGFCNLACQLDRLENPMLFGMDPTTDALDASQGAGTCAAYVTSGTLTCVAELAPGGAYAGYCNAICGFDFINYPDLYPDSIWAQIATNFVVPWLEEMGQPSTVAEAVARMVPATVTSDGVASPGLCEQLIESLGYERMCRGQPGVSASGVYPGVLHPEMCHSGPGGHWDVLGATFGYCEGMCDFACGECQNTDLSTYVSPAAAAWNVSANCDNGACCSYDPADTNATAAYPGDHAHCSHYITNHGCANLLAPDRLLNQCDQGGMCCDLGCGYCPTPDPAALCAGVECGAGSCNVSSSGAAECRCDAGHIGATCNFPIDTCNATSTTYNIDCCTIATTYATFGFSNSMYNSMMARGANFYDEATSPGECDALLASGALTCHDDFAPGMSLAGYCEFACDFCPIIDPCDTLNCGDNGVCASGACECSPGFIGELCQIPLESCTTTSDCCASLPDFASMQPSMPDYLSWATNIFDSIPNTGSSCSGMIGGIANASGATIPEACGAHFAPGREFGGYCDFSCGYCMPACDHVSYMSHLAHDVSKNNHDRTSGYGACALDVAAGWNSCPATDRASDFYQQCRGTCGCGPSSLGGTDDGSACLGPLVAALANAFASCGDTSPTSCATAACQSDLAAVEALATTGCVPANELLILNVLPSYPNRIGVGLLAEFNQLEQTCDPLSCDNQYHAVQTSCLSAALDQSCASSACTAALATLNSGTCLGMNSNGNVPSSPSLPDMREFTLLSNLYCSGNCSTYEYEVACGAGIALGQCSSECQAAATALVSRASECFEQWSALYDVYRTPGVWVAAVTDTVAACGAGITVIDTAGDLQAEQCFTALTNAETTCAAAGVTGQALFNSTRCASVECVAAINIIVQLHDQCVSHPGVTSWSLVTAEVERLAEVHCPCQDHDLGSYGTLSTSLAGSECADLAVSGQCTMDIGEWIPSLAGSPISSICCQSCSAGACLDQAECTTRTPSFVSQGLVLDPSSSASVCSAQVSSVFPVALVNTTFAQYCAASCQSCVSMCQGAWGTWSSCSALCGGGQRQRSYVVTQVAENGGEPCTSDGAIMAGGDSQREPCNPAACIPLLHQDGTSCSIPYDGDGNGYVDVRDLINLLSAPNVSVGEILGLLSYFGAYCFSKAAEYATYNGR